MKGSESFNNLEIIKFEASFTYRCSMVVNESDTSISSNDSKFELSVTATETMYRTRTINTPDVYCLVINSNR